MKRLLLNMMEWHARTTHGWNFDTWHRGRFLEEWANPQALEELHNVFAHYDEDDIARALFATMDLFHWLAIQTAERLSYPYPYTVDEHVTGWIRTCLSEKGRTDSHG